MERVSFGGHQDRHLTTFKTKWGRYRYRCAPQGYKVSGDAYTHRYDKITMGVKDVKRVIDYMLLYATDLEGSFSQVTNYLTLVGNNGIVLNSDKFSFGEDTVDWAGIRITEDKAQPLLEHVKAIREFPAPINAQLLGIGESGRPLLLCPATPAAIQRAAQEEDAVVLGRAATEVV
jgi:hypothetical protein